MKSILITGASRGVGRELAVKCAASGKYDKICINCLKNESALAETAQAVEKAGDVRCITSVGNVGDIKYVETLPREFGQIDVLVNNAAISYVGLLIDMKPEEWDNVIKTNISSIYNTCHTFVPDMIRKQSGYILNISSVWGQMGASCEVAYSAAKGAVNSFTKALAKELGPSHIQVNAAALGIVDTEMNGHLSFDEKCDIADDVPMGRIASPDEIAEALLKLLDMPEYFTGEIVRIDGGWM